MRARLIFARTSIILNAVHAVHADIKFTSPAPGSTFAASTPITIAWVESGIVPLLSEFTQYDLFLCAGGADISHVHQLATVTEKAKFTNGNQVIASIDPTLGGSDLKNAYFFRMVATLISGGTLITYSPRFSLTGMTGRNNPAIIEGVQWNGANPYGPPKTLYSPTDPLAQHPMDPWNIPINLQSGPTIYAAMQSYPGTKITAKHPTRLYPTSPFKIATTAMPPNSLVLKTQTQAATWGFVQRMNPESPAPGPSSDMHRFLNRWKD